MDWYRETAFLKLLLGMERGDYAARLVDKTSRVKYEIGVGFRSAHTRSLRQCIPEVAADLKRLSRGTRKLLPTSQTADHMMTHIRDAYGPERQPTVMISCSVDALWLIWEIRRRLLLKRGRVDLYIIEIKRLPGQTPPPHLLEPSDYLHLSTRDINQIETASQFAKTAGERLAFRMIPDKYVVGPWSFTLDIMGFDLPPELFRDFRSFSPPQLRPSQSWIHALVWETDSSYPKAALKADLSQAELAARYVAGFHLDRIISWKLNHIWLEMSRIMQEEAKEVRWFCRDLYNPLRRAVETVVGDGYRAGTGPRTWTAYFELMDEGSSGINGGTDAMNKEIEAVDELGSLLRAIDFI